MFSVFAVPTFVNEAKRRWTTANNSNSSKLLQVGEQPRGVLKLNKDGYGLRKIWVLVRLDIEYRTVPILFYFFLQSAACFKISHDQKGSNAEMLIRNRYIFSELQVLLVRYFSHRVNFKLNNKTFNLSLSLLKHWYSVEKNKDTKLK